MSRIIQFKDDHIERSALEPLLFAALTPATQDALRAAAPARRFAPGALIQQRGDEAAGFWLIEAGSVAVGQFLDHGEFRAVGLLGPGDSYGELAVLSGRPRIADAVARETSVLRHIPAAAFERALADDPMSRRAVMGGLAAQLQETLTVMAGIRRGTSTARAAAVLANLAGHSASPRRISVTQQEIADLLGVTRATANAALRDLESAGLIRRHYGVIEVPDARKLRRTTLA